MTRRFLMALAMAVTVCVTGCTKGDWLIPGGGTSYDVIVNGPNNRIASFKTNANTDLDEASYDPVTHAIKIKGLRTNGSDLASVQQIAVIAQVQANAKLAEQLAALAQSVLASGIVTGGGIGGIAGGVTTTQPVADTPEQATLRAALLAKVKDCPFLAQVPSQQAMYYKYVQGAPSSSLADILAFVNKISLVPVTVP